MSTTENVPLVIVRSYGDEPVALCALALEHHGTRVRVARSAEARGISLPAEDVVSFEDSLYEKLMSAFRRGDSERLRQIWIEARSDEKACNRYRDVLGSMHAQEEAEVPDSGEVT